MVWANWSVGPPFGALVLHYYADNPRNSQQQNLKSMSPETTILKQELTFLPVANIDNLPEGPFCSQIESEL